ncbi:hypothetical protein MP638_005454 [Amoeboaphelidium occidentale]|nr:hypothetical protein MP638_005454 [Amoeboaphelidium occidentale]
MTISEFCCVANIAEPYSNEKILDALKSNGVTCTDIRNIESINENIIYWVEYEDIPWNIIQRSDRAFANAYPIRKALIRKAQNANTIMQFLAKKPDRLLAQCFPATYPFELDHPDYMDELLNECYEVRDSLCGENDDVWIMKPSLANRGQGIFLIKSIEELEALMWRIEEAEEEGDEEFMGLADLKEWVFQKYISNPLLLPSDDRKFHIRTYVLAIGNMKVFVFHEMLMLFAPEKYDQGDLTNSKSHLTNTCLHAEQQEHTSNVVRLLSESIHPVLSGIKGKIGQLVGDIFESCHAQPAMFQPQSNCFELYGLDFLVDGTGNPWFIEANAFPDFKQTGDELGNVISRLFSDTLQLITSVFAKKVLPDETLFHLVYDKVHEG